MFPNFNRSFVDKFERLFETKEKYDAWFENVRKMNFLKYFFRMKETTSKRLIA